MKCLTCPEEIPFSKWKKQCLPCYKNDNPYPRKKKKKYNPCDGCGGEDCACCEYARGW